MDDTVKNTDETCLAPPLLSVICPAYNQEAFIAQALDGLLAQQTDFRYEILINDDASTDATARIIAHYAERHPTIIRAFYQQVNQYSQGRACVPGLFGDARGRYIAYCEADDYWTDPRKLQQQVDFLEAHADYVITYHDAFVFDEHGQYGVQLQGHLRADASALELQQARRLSTLTVCFRNVFSQMPPELSLCSAPLNDMCWWSLLGAYGKGKFMAGIKPAAYRMHPGGVFSMRSDKRKLHMNLQTCSSLANYYNRLGNQPLYQYFLMQTVCLSLAALAPRHKLQTLCKVAGNVIGNLARRLLPATGKAHVQ
ncbi:MULTISPECIES: glycosyltransferase family 2 protein [Pseudomonas]|uniref:Glycosyltransferase family A protein n=2 Tax=Pseudomonas fragariae (ex Marin et al. 2024) TaxID=3080056 RepID=A0ABU5B6S7_9PSED|nr:MULTISPECIES: glycosyltransferase family A protein [Pseudomonas]MCW6055539.1 glycosyltransferase family 2 protein [Pseudomonas fragi]KWS19300.1 glycosyl transferase family 2 [Pseudomonas syringae pv. syringae]MCF4986876.1 glycosyltransferase [Pseudomonas syringae]MCF5204398.1 glycosyltransferase [Pseudomonas syringae]MCF5270683.1 glycosyltransferase [Pseudomonas syringae]